MAINSCVKSNNFREMVIGRTASWTTESWGNFPPSPRCTRVLPLSLGHRFLGHHVTQGSRQFWSCHISPPRRPWQASDQETSPCFLSRSPNPCHRHVSLAYSSWPGKLHLSTTVCHCLWSNVEDITNPYLKGNLDTLSGTGTAMLFSAGTFLCVATVHVLPEVTNVGHGHSNGGDGKARFSKAELMTLVVGAILPLFLTMGHHHWHMHIWSRWGLGGEQY